MSVETSNSETSQIFNTLQFQAMPKVHAFYENSYGKQLVLRLFWQFLFSTGLILELWIYLEIFPNFNLEIWFNLFDWHSRNWQMLLKNVLKCLFFVRDFQRCRLKCHGNVAMSQTAPTIFSRLNDRIATNSGIHTVGCVTNRKLIDDVYHARFHITRNVFETVEPKKTIDVICAINWIQPNRITLEGEPENHDFDQFMSQGFFFDC